MKNQECQSAVDFLKILNFSQMVKKSWPRVDARKGCYLSNVIKTVAMENRTRAAPVRK